MPIFFLFSEHKSDPVLLQLLSASAIKAMNSPAPDATVEMESAFFHLLNGCNLHRTGLVENLTCPGGPEAGLPRLRKLRCQPARPFHNNVPTVNKPSFFFF